MDSVAASRRQRRTYYLVILLGIAIAVPLAIVTRWLVFALGIQAPARGLIVMLVPSLEVAGAIAFAMVRYLRCPQCKTADWALAFARPTTRRCPVCQAEIV